MTATTINNNGWQGWQWLYKRRSELLLLKWCTMSPSKKEWRSKWLWIWRGSFLLGTVSSIKYLNQMKTKGPRRWRRYTISKNHHSSKPIYLHGMTDKCSFRHNNNQLIWKSEMKYSLLGFSVWRDEEFFCQVSIWSDGVDKWLSQWAYQVHRWVDFMWITNMAVKFAKNLLDGSEDDALWGQGANCLTRRGRKERWSSRDYQGIGLGML